jgi:hypothetical protein
MSETVQRHACAAAPDELGETIADVRRLARKATRIFIHIRITPEGWQTSCLMLTPSAFLRSVAHAPDGEPMPGKLYTPPSESNERWLAIGH